MTGASIAIEHTTPADTILSVKQRVFAVNRQLSVHRQRLMYRPGPHGMEPLADKETLGGAGVAQDGSAELDLLMEPLTAAEATELGKKVTLPFPTRCDPISNWTWMRIPLNVVPASFQTWLSKSRFDHKYIVYFMRCDQLLEFSKDGRLDIVRELLTENVNVEFQDRVRPMCVSVAGLLAEDRGRIRANFCADRVFVFDCACFRWAKSTSSAAFCMAGGRWRFEFSAVVLAL